MADPQLQFITAAIAVFAGIFYFLFSTTVLIRAKLSNKIGLSLFQLGPWIIVYVLLLGIILFVDYGIINNLNGPIPSRSIIIIGALFIAEMLPFLLALMVPLGEVGTNYKEATAVVKIGGAAVGAGTLGKVVARERGINEKGFDATAGAGVAISAIGMMSLVNFKSPPWSLIRKIFLGAVGLFAALTIILYLLGM